MSISINDLKPFVTPEETINFNGLEIKVKKHISETQRINIANQIANMIYDISIQGESGFSNKDLKNVFVVNAIVGLYTDIDLGDFDSYVDICEIATTSGLYDTIRSTLPRSEKNMLSEAIEYAIAEKKHELLMNKLEEIKAESVETQLTNFLNKAIEKIPDDKKIISIVKTLKKEVNGLKPDKLKFIKDAVATLGGKETPDIESLNTAIYKVTDLVSKKQN